MLRGRRTMGALAASALVLGGGIAASGCGSSSSGDSGSKDLKVLDQAAAATAKQQTYHVTSSVTETIQGKSFVIQTSGNTSGKQAELTMDFAPILDSFGGAQNPEIAGVLDKLGGASALKADMIVDGKNVLIKMPAIQNAIKTFAHKTVPPWASLDLDKVGQLAGIDLGALLDNSTGTQSAIGYLKALSGGLKKLGTEQVGGASTTHYRGTIDFANIPDTVPAQLKKTLEQTAAVLKKTKSSTKVPFDVWVDGQNLVRRELITQDVNGAKAVTKVDIGDYGKPVTIDVPSASDQFDVLGLVEQLAPGVLEQIGKQVKTQTGTTTP